MWFIFELGDGAARDNMVRKYCFLIWSPIEHSNWDTSCFLSCFMVWPPALSPIKQCLPTWKNPVNPEQPAPVKLPVLPSISEECWVGLSLHFSIVFTLLSKVLLLYHWGSLIFFWMEQFYQLPTNQHHAETSRALYVHLCRSFQVECRLIAPFQADKVYLCVSFSIEDLCVQFVQELNASADDKT